MSEGITEYNMDHKDELLLIDFRPSLQSDIQKAWGEKRQCMQVIETPGLSLNQYLHDAYSGVANRLESLLAEWNKRFPGEVPIDVISMVGVMA